MGHKIDIKKLRGKLQLTQTEFSTLLGVHPLTISKWERGAGEPIKNYFRLLYHIEHATKNKRLCEEINKALIFENPLKALYIILHNSYKD